MSKPQMKWENDLKEISSKSAWDHTSHDNFIKYYAEQSLSESTILRFLDVREKVLRLLGPIRSQQCLQVADIGCGAGTQSFLWAELGHRVFGIDINEGLLNLARERNVKINGTVTFHLGSATELPWPDESMDVCLVPELLEHISDWESCLKEFKRILKPNGVLYLSTTNKLCPRQSEFNLPLYAWYPSSVKHYIERLAKTTHPQLANFATYPAVNWFSYYSLRSALDPKKFDCLDRFDRRLHEDKSHLRVLVLKVICALPVLRFIGHIITPYTLLLAIKRA